MRCGVRRASPTPTGKRNQPTMPSSWPTTPKPRTERRRAQARKSSKVHAAKVKAARVLPPCACGQPATFWRIGKCRSCHYRDLCAELRARRAEVVYPPCACGKKHYALGRCFNCYERARRRWDKGQPAEDEGL